MVTVAQKSLPTKTVGFIVNPVAGMGGAVGLKGTDGKAILKKPFRWALNPSLHKGQKPFSPNLFQLKKVYDCLSALAAWARLKLRNAVYI